MTWFPRKRREIERDRAQAVADDALEQAKGDLRATRARGREVMRVAERLRHLQQENHFAENLRTIYGGSNQ